MKSTLYSFILLCICHNLAASTNYCTNTEVSATTFYYNTIYFNACKINDQYELQNKLKQIYIWNQANVTSCSAPFNHIPSQNGHSFFENHEIESTVLWVAEKTHNYFAEQFNWLGLDGDGSAINVLIVNHDNFGYCPANKRIFIGRQSKATIDIIAHEIFHGISHAAVGLSNSGESEALKESFSDIFGEVIEHEILSTNDWLVNAIPNNSATAIRSFKNPNLFEDAKIYLTDPYWEDEYGGKYKNAGVQNHWFYLLSTGNQNVDGIGIHQAATIVFKTLSDYLLPNATYYDVRFASIQAAKDIFGANNTQQIQVALAWDEVGVFDLNNCLDTYVITSSDDFNNMPPVCNFISTQGNILVPQNAEITLIADNWIGIQEGFEVPKNTTFTIKINKYD